MSCASITSSSGIKITWVPQLRYLGVFITQFRTFKCALDHAKKSFYRSANMIFGKLGRIASEDVVLELITRSQAVARTGNRTASQWTILCRTRQSNSNDDKSKTAYQI